MQQTELPPGAFVDQQTGQVLRIVRKHTGGKVVLDGREVDEVELIPRRVYASRAEARAKGGDYYDRALGWLRNGRKREAEHPENLGAQVQRYRVLYEDPETGELRELPAEPAADATPAKAAAKSKE